jgi:copper chaperone CopZ
VPLSDSEPSNRFRISNPARILPPLLGAALAALGLAAPACGEVKRLTFPVSGLHSPLATRGIEEAIRTLPGVASVSADLGSGRVDVQAEDQKSLNIQDVRTRAARAGFPVSGDLDVEARGRFEIGAERRITFKVAGTTYSWQVLESGTLLDLFRAYPTLRGDFVAGFRLHDGAAWTRPAITLTDWRSIPPSPLPGAPSGGALRSASPVAAAPQKPSGAPQKPSAAPQKPSGVASSKPAAGKAAPAKGTPVKAASEKSVATKSGAAKSAPATPAVSKNAVAKAPEPLARKERRDLKKKPQAPSDTDKALPQRR